MYFLKLDSTGAIMWSKSHGGTNQESGHSVIQTTDGGFLGVGYTNSWGAGGFDLFLVKLDVNGNLEYEEYYGGSDWDFAWDVVEVKPNEFVIAGETQSFGAGNADAWLVKYNANYHSFEWDKTVGLPTYENFKALAKGENGTVLAVGKGIKSGRNDEDVFITRFDSMGDTLWTNYYGDTLQDYANDVVWMSDGNYSLTGRITSITRAEINLLQIDTIGNVLLQNNWSVDSLFIIGNKISEIDSSRIGIIGTREVAPNNLDMFFAYSRPSSLDFMGGTTQGGQGDDIGNSFVFMADSGIMITGITDGFQSSFTDIITFKTNRFGNYDQKNFSQNYDTTNVLSSSHQDNYYTKIKYLPSDKSISINSNQNYREFNLFNILGVVVANGKLNSDPIIELNNYNLKSGVYILQLYPNSKRFYKFYIH